MKNFLVLVIAAVALLGLSTADLSACGGEKTSETKSTSASVSGCGAKTATSGASAKLVDSKSTDAKVAHSKASCAATCAGARKTGASAASADECTIDGKTCNVTTLAISGMTCGACENTVTAALAGVPGVMKVAKVSYESGEAAVCYDPTTVKADKLDLALTRAVANRGFKAEVIPAVARTTDTEPASKLTGSANSCPFSKQAKTAAKAEEAAGTQ